MFCIKIANFEVGIDNKYDMVHRLCRDYLSDEKPSFIVSASEQDIAKEREQSQEDYSEGYLESVCIYRNMCLKFPMYDALLYHGAVVEVDGVGYMFAAHSGVGKSTHIALWKKFLGDKAVIINGDKPILRKVGNKIFAYGTPWCGKEGLNTNKATELKSICFIQRGKDNKIFPLPKDEAVKKSMHQIIMPSQPLAAIKTLEMLDFVIKNTNCWHLDCNMDVEAAKVCYSAMKENKNED